MTREEQVELIRHKYAALAPLLNERTRRCWAATEAQALGYGGIRLVAQALGLARGTIHAGLAEVQARGATAAGKRIPRLGGGGQKHQGKTPTGGEAPKSLVGSHTLGGLRTSPHWD